MLPIPGLGGPSLPGFSDSGTAAQDVNYTGANFSGDFNVGGGRNKWTVPLIIVAVTVLVVVWLKKGR